jgi:DNA-binding NarL/FixJ family response regulator
VTKQLAMGLTYKKIAGQMDISYETMKKHLKNIYCKLKVKNKIGGLNKVKLL